MSLLLVAATEPEIAPLLSAMNLCGSLHDHPRIYEFNGRKIDVLITGVGMVATAARVSRVLARTMYTHAVNAGICGSFDRAIALGEVLRVQTDFMPELGAEDGEQFLSVHELNLAAKNDFPYTNGMLQGSDAEVFGSLLQLKAASGITVNKVHGHEASIAALQKRVQAQTESMEGAAFYYACAIAGVPAMQVRAVSNYVEKRNRDAWKIGEAVKNLNAELLKFLEQQ